MTFPDPTPVISLARLLAGELLSVLVPVGSVFSVVSLAFALGVALLVTARARRRRGRTVRLKVLLRALFPRRMLHHRSVRADIGFFLLNVFLTGALLGWAILSSDAVAGWTRAELAGVLGAPPLRAVPAWASGALTTAALFLAYELGYYADHWLSHHVPALWELHKPHHTAETLTPVTNFRMHPLDSLVFLNLLALATGTTAGLCGALFGPGHEALLAGRNVLFFALWFSLGHLQHSNLWITLPGPLGRMLISPAHHQLHHSADPRHHGKNLGSLLCLFDWVFGTLRHPNPVREPLVFGVEGDTGRHHSIAGGLIDPVVRACATLRGPPEPRQSTSGGAWASSRVPALRRAD